MDIRSQREMDNRLRHLYATNVETHRQLEGLVDVSLASFPLYGLAHIVSRQLAQDYWLLGRAVLTENWTSPKKYTAYCPWHVLDPSECRITPFPSSDKIVLDVWLDRWIKLGTEEYVLMRRRGHEHDLIGMSVFDPETGKINVPIDLKQFEEQFAPAIQMLSDK